MRTRTMIFAVVLFAVIVFANTVIAQTGQTGWKNSDQPNFRAGTLVVGQSGAAKYYYVIDGNLRRQAAGVLCDGQCITWTPGWHISVSDAKAYAAFKKATPDKKRYGVITFLTDDFPPRNVRIIAQPSMPVSNSPHHGGFVGQKFIPRRSVPPVVIYPSFYVYGPSGPKT